VHVDDAHRPRLLVKVVHVLGADKEAILRVFSSFRKGEVSRIPLGGRRNPPPHGIEFPHQPGIAVPILGRSNLLDPIVPPEAIHPTETWDAALHAHSCSSKDEEAVGGENGEHGNTRETKPTTATWRNDYGTKLP
jgi:hypothetical protein